jgi:putative peptidoglycan lipid II flippase
LARLFHIRIFRDAISVGAGTIAVYVATFVRDISMAGVFGRGPVFEGYLIALLLPMTAVSVLASACDAAVLPAYVRLGQAGSRESRASYVSTISFVFLVIGAGLALVLAALSPWIGGWLLAPANPAIAYVRPIALLLSPLALVGAVTPLLVAVLNATRRFWITSLAPAAVPVTVVLGLGVAVAVGVRGDGGMWVISIATLLGTLVQASLLLRAFAKTEKIGLPRWNGFSLEVQSSFHAYMPILIGSLLMTGTTFVDQAMAASLAPGSLAALNYGGKVVTLVSNAGAIAISTAAFPEFARLLAERRHSDALYGLMQIVRLVMFIAVPAASLIWLLSKPIVGTIFQRGAFSPDDTSVVAGIQAMYALQIPWYIAGMVIARFLAALGSSKTILGIAGTNLVLKVLLNLLLMRLMGVRGLALSTSIVYLVSFCLCLQMARRHLRIRAGR